MPLRCLLVIYLCNIRCLPTTSEYDRIATLNPSSNQFLKPGKIAITNQRNRLIFECKNKKELAFEEKNHEKPAFIKKYKKEIFSLSKN